MVKRFQFLGKALRPSVYAAMKLSAKRMRKDVVSERLSGPRGAYGILGVVTGAARRSIASETFASNEQITALFGSALGYVKAHEEGFKGVEKIRAHERRRRGKIKAVSIAAATRGKVTKRAAPTAAQRRAGSISVSAHSRKVNIVAKHFIRDTLRAAKIPTENRILRALTIAASTGRIPTPDEIGG